MRERERGRESQGEGEREGEGGRKGLGGHTDSERDSSLASRYSTRSVMILEDLQADTILDDG